MKLKLKSDKALHFIGNFSLSLILYFIILMIVVIIDTIIKDKSLTPKKETIDNVISVNKNHDFVLDITYIDNTHEVDTFSLPVDTRFGLTLRINKHGNGTSINTDGFNLIYYYTTNTYYSEDILKTNVINFKILK